MSTSFQSQKGKEKQKQHEDENPLTDQNKPMANMRDDMRRRMENPGDYVDFDIPWSLNLSYSLNFNKRRTRDYKRDTTVFAQSLNFSGDISLTPKWKISLSSGFDFIHKQLTYSTINITRDLHCWRMTISIVPMGFYKSFSISLSPTSSILHDIKINRTRQFYDVFDNQRR